jgi:hypothetical protein
VVDGLKKGYPQTEAAAKPLVHWDTETLTTQEKKEGAAHQKNLDTTPPLRGCRGYAMRNSLIFRLCLFTSTVYALIFLIFWLSNYVIRYPSMLYT